MAEYQVREAGTADLQGLLRLYLHLHEDHVPDADGPISDVWRQILSDPHQHVILCEAAGEIVSSCVCVVIPNLTRDGRPYALVENVVTDSRFRKQGYASACLKKAHDIAAAENCYKIMLLTGSKNEATHRFYQRAGYNNTDKTAYIQWL